MTDKTRPVAIWPASATLPALVVLLVGALVAPPAAGAADLPLRQVWLYSSGLALFRHEGTVEGDDSFALELPRAEVADVLKSLSVDDLDGGRVSPTYDADEPLTQRLARLPIDLSGAPSLEHILQQARGQQLRVVPFNGTAISGTLISVETRAAATPDTPNQSYLVIAVGGQINSLALAQLQTIAFVDEQLQRSFQEALAIIGAGVREQMRRITIRFSGTGRRRVVVRYLRPAPVWKISYRIHLPLLGAGVTPGDRGTTAVDGLTNAALRGYAHIDNTSGMPWTNVALSVVAGHPLAFQMDLYTPLMRSRPVLSVDTGPAIAAPQYDQEFKTQDAMAAAPGSRADGRGGAPMAESMARPLFAPSAAPAVAAAPAPGAPGSAPPTTGAAMGAAFAFHSTSPVTVPRGQSAMVELFTASVPIRRRSIFDAAVFARHPLAGVELQNATAFFLPAGPVTVYGAEGYLGDARIGDTVPASRQLLSFAIESGIEVRVETRAPTEEITAIRVAEGIMIVEQRRRRETVYVATQRSTDAAPVWIIHPRTSAFQVRSPAPETETASSYRFALPTSLQADGTLTVVEEQPLSTRVTIQTARDDQLLLYLSQRVVSAELRRALENVIELRRRLATARSATQALTNEQAEIFRDQERLRANMGTLAQDSALYRRYTATLDQQETRLRELTRLIEQARAEETRAADALSQYVSQLNVP